MKFLDYNGLQYFYNKIKGDQLSDEGKNIVTEILLGGDDNAA